MTERIDRGASEAGDRSEFTRAKTLLPQANVSASVIDQAVEETFSEAGVSQDVARVMRSLMASDSQSAVAKAYYHGVAGAGTISTLGVSRRSYEVPYMLSDEQVASLSAYAPDFSLKFAARELHDHPMAAACRAVDRMIVESRLPPLGEVSHVGGAVLPLVMSGRLGRGHHACVPVVDRKDPARHVMLNLRLRKIAADSRVSDEVRTAARGYLDGSQAHVCNGLVQDCLRKTPVLTCVHVYDVPMTDWAAVMDRKGARLMEGCMLFPRQVFSRSSGEMDVAGARYELDASEDTFRMGFVGSPSWWYQHKLSEYLRYGADQVLSAGRGGGTYSYKIVERRGDTIFFRVLRVSHETPAEYSQVYRVPGVPMVRVNGFPLTPGSPGPHSWTRHTYLFPAALWQDMLAHAKECFERGVLTHERMFAYYRTVAPRQSINGVVVAGGATVDDLNQLLPLVVHVVLFAMLEVRKTRAETSALVDAAMHKRLADKELTMYKLAAAFGAAVKSVASLVFFPFWFLADLVDAGLTQAALSRLPDWDFQPVVQDVGAHLVLPAVKDAAAAGSVVGFDAEYALAAPVDMVLATRASPSLAAFAVEAFGEALPDEIMEPVRKAVDTEAVSRPASANALGATKDGFKPAVPSTASSTLAPTAELLAELPYGEVERRRSSIREAIAESRSEAAKCEAACASQYAELVVAAQPHVKKMEARREMFGNPDFWKVTGGVLESSISGAPVDGFLHSAVYVPIPQGGTRLVRVVEEVYKGMSRGEYVERLHHRMLDSGFTGWAYTNDSLMVYNGPSVERALETALDLPLDFAITLHQGPPGCGKTTKIIEASTPGDVVLVPARKASRETRVRMVEHGAMSEDVASQRVRTLDSYLVNQAVDRKVKALSCVRLMADEAFMAREGRWLAAAALLGAQEVHAYGDRNQIPHVPRAECPRLFVKLRPQTVVEEFVSYRCPPELVACWGGVFDWRVRSASEVRGEVSMHQSASGMEVPRGCVLMGMYQADKKRLAELYSAVLDRVQIMTVHESQGNTYRHVWLHRFDLRKRTDRYSLYDREEYVLVAMSRSTHTFRYVSASLGDVVEQWVTRGKDKRRVSAAADRGSAGESLEKL